jgi:hypothetical protein
MDYSVPSSPQWRKTRPVLVDSETVRKAEQEIISCEACSPDDAEIPFDYVLDSITGCDPEITDYVLARPAECPRCSGKVRPGYWRWYTSDEGCRAFILPGTLVVLRNP